MAKFLIADDHPLFRQAMVAALAPLFLRSEIIQSDSLHSTLEALSLNPDTDLILLDLHMPDCENFYGLIRVSEDYPNIPIAVVSASDSVAVVSRVMDFGAKGFIPKSAAILDIAQALQAIMEGKTWLPQGMDEKLSVVDDEAMGILQMVAELTPKQFQVLKLLQDGLLNKQIANVLSISEATVKAHISAIFRKLEVSTRTQAALILNQFELPY